MTIKTLQENKSIFEAYKAKVIKEDVEKWRHYEEIPLTLQRRPPVDMDPERPTYYVTGEITINREDDSDRNREYGYGPYERVRVEDIEVTSVDYINTSGDAVDITDTLEPSEVEEAKETLRAKWEETI